MLTEIGSDIQKAKDWLDCDELVAIPTETVYGLAANALSARVVAKIYEVKNRPQFNPLILHVGNKNDIGRYTTHIPDKIQALIEDFMPGPLTVLLPKSSLVPDIVTAGSSKVAIRIPQSHITLELLKNIKYPLAAPSANLSGYVSPTSPQHVLDQLNSKIPYILDGGQCSVGIESTIIGYDEKSQKIVLHRMGGLSIGEIEDRLGENIVLDITHSKPNTPGQLKSHYATITPLYLGDITQLYSNFSGQKIVIINYSNQKSFPVFKQYVLSENASDIEAAQRLFATLREADSIGADVILAELAPDFGLGKAINDRLSRAQHILK